MDAFVKSLLRTFFGELGAKPFFLALLLTAWVATWEGTRLAKGGHQRHHQLMVLVGTLAGLLLHSILVAFHTISKSGSPAFGFTGAMLLVGLGMKVHLELRYAQDREASLSEEGKAVMKKEKDEVFNPLAAPLTAPNQTPWNRFAFRTQPQPPPAEGYGSTSAPTAAEPEPVKPVEEDRLPIYTLFFAGFLSMTLAFLVQVGEASSLQLGEQKDFMLILSSNIGYFLSTCIAVLIGYLMESVLHPDIWVLFAAELGFFAMALVCFSQAVLGLNSLKATLALLQALST